MEGKQKLFRSAAIAACFQRQGSAILVTTELSGRIVAFFALLVSAAILGLASWGEVTRTVTVSGTLVPERGIIRVFSPQQGVVIAKRFVFGDHVERGQALYTLSSDRIDAGGAALAAGISAVIRDRITSFRTTVEATRRLQVEERARLARQRDDLARIIHEKCAIKAKPLISLTTMRMGCLMKFFAMKFLAQVFGGLGRFRAVR